ncbi:MAG: transporter substrate-binding domain-containing protein [Proteocatella sp.]
MIEIDYLENVDRILYAADQNAPPLRFVDKTDGQYKGVVIDYLSQLSLELGINIDTKPLKWEDALRSLKSGNSQICDVFPNQERAEFFIFTKPIYNLRAAVAVNKNYTGNTEKLFSKKIRLATQKGDYLNSYMAKHYPNVELVYTQDLESAFELLKNNMVDAVAGDEPVISYFNDSVKYPDIKILATTLYENSVVFALPKNETILLSILNKGIDSINAKNQLEKIQQKWFGISAPITYPTKFNLITKYVFFAFIPFLILLLAVLYINGSLKRRVLEYSQKEQTRERLSLQSNKMAAIGELASGIAHEIRNPLGIIRTHSFILKNNPDADENMLKSIGYIDSAVERASRIIDNLLNFSKISGENKESTNMKTFVENIVLLENKLLTKRNILFELNCSPCTIVPVNQESMKHIIINMFSNAIDALCMYDSNGNYTQNINTCPKIIVDIYVDKDDKSLKMNFADNGVGLSKENADQIFNPFFTTKGPNKGTGLGLYIVYNEISKLGGKIWLESQLNEGATFFVSLPLNWI